MGLSIYDARLYRSRGRPRRLCRPTRPFALQLIYKRRLYGGRIAERSVEEMTKLGYGTKEQRARWGVQLPADAPRCERWRQPHRCERSASRGVRFYQNGEALGSIDDSEFARAFFAIWLRPAHLRARAAQAASRGKPLSPPAAPRTQIEARSAQVPHGT